MDFDSLTTDEKKAFVDNVFRQIEDRDKTILNLYLWIAALAFVSLIALWLFAGDKIFTEWNH